MPKAKGDPYFVSCRAGAEPWPAEFTKLHVTPDPWQPEDVVLLLLAQGIERGSQDQCIGQAREAGRAKGRKVRVGPLRRVRRVAVPEPLHVGAGEQEVRRERLVAPCVEIAVRHGVDQHLQIKAARATLRCLIQVPT